MEILSFIGKVLLVGLAVFGVADALFFSGRKNYSLIWQTWKRFRLGMFFQSFGVLLVVAAIVLMLFTFVPFTRWGWLNLFYQDGGNMLIEPIQDGSRSDNQFVRMLPPLFFATLIVALPFMAKAEEEMFRKNHETWKGIVWKSIQFGPIHCLVGVPLAAGIALIVAGLFYGYVYKRAYERNVEQIGHIKAQEEAVMVSTAYHTMWNTIAVGILLLIALAAVFQ